MKRPPHLHAVPSGRPRPVKSSPLVEERVCSTLLNYPDLAWIRDLLEPDMFRDPFQQTIFRAIKHYKEKADVFSVWQYCLEAQWEIEDTTIGTLMQQGINSVFHQSAHLYAKTIVEAHYDEVIRTAAADIDNPLDRAAALAEDKKRILDLLLNREDKPWEQWGYHLDELEFKDLPELQWVIPDILPAGFTVLGGATKIGKSSFMRNLLAALAYGGVALGHIPVEKQRVLYLSLEDHEASMQHHIQQLTYPNMPWPHEAHVMHQWPSFPDGARMLDRYLTEEPDTRLVMIDTWPKLMGHRRDSNDYLADYQEGSAMANLAMKHGTSILASVHAKKGETNDVFDRIQGTRGITAAADHLMVINRDRFQDEGKLSITSRFLPDKEYVINTAGGSWRLVGEAREHETTKEQQAILDVLRDYGDGAHSRTVAKEINKNPGSVRQALNRMQKSGLVQKGEKDLWHIKP